MKSRMLMLNGVLAAVLVATTALLYPQLPERIPTHFDGSLQPDAWGSRSTFLLLPLLGLAAAAIMLLVARFAVRSPGAVNMPGKERLLALPAAEQQWALQPVRTLLEFLGAVMLLLFIVIQLVTWYSTQGSDVATAGGTALFAIVGVILVSPLWLLVALQRRIDAAHRRVRLGQPPPA